MAQNMKDEDDELIDSFETFLKRQGLVDWPLVTFDENFKAEECFDELWSKMKEHESSMALAECKKAEEVSLNDKKYNLYVEEAHKRRKEESEIVTPKICIKDYDYPGFYEVHASPIPGQPDAFLLLDIVSEVQGFNPGFLKIWKPFFVSHVSVSMFKDTFWWFFLHRFKANMEEDQNQLFDRIAGGFVSLLMTVQMNLKDKLFKVYADCLAQAVFTSFYKAFPASQEQFGDEFKTDVADLINFWVSGVKPKLLSWQSWKLAELCPADEGESVKDSACDRESAFEELVSKAQKLTVSVPTLVESNIHTTGEGKMDRKRESHFIGPGPQFQYVSFKQCGQSPLVLRYLQNFGIPTLAGSFTRKMRRTEISSLPPCKPTYQDVLSEMEMQSRKRLQQHNMLCQQTKEEITKIQRVNVINNMAMNRMQKEIFNNRTELKIASEGIMSYWDHPPYRHRLSKTKNPEQPSESLKEKEAAHQ